MRTEKEILDLITTFAMQYDSIRAVIMNGSRINPKATKDPFQDYDVVYLVTDVAEFSRKESIPQYFGDPMIVQLPEDMQDPPPQGGNRYIYLMQFLDGTRVDLRIYSVSDANEILSDSLSLVLLDKDGVLGKVPSPSDAAYTTRPPVGRAFADSCNEFWWLNTYVAKAIWRDQLPLAKYVMEALLRPQLIKVLSWKVVLAAGRPIALGKHGALLKRHMSLNDWAAFRSTFADANSDRMFEALINAGLLFRSSAMKISAELGYSYPSREDNLVSDFVQRIRGLPAGAQEL